MTNREKIKYLSQYVVAGLEYDEALESLQRYRAKIESAKIPIITDMPTAPPQAKDKLAGHIANIEKIEEIVNIRMARLQEMRISVENLIGRVEDSNERRLLTLRYLEGFTWIKIAYVMNYSWQHLHRLHSKVLTMIVIKDAIEWEYLSVLLLRCGN